MHRILTVKIYIAPHHESTVLIIPLQPTAHRGYMSSLDQDKNGKTIQLTSVVGSPYPRKPLIFGSIICVNFRHFWWWGCPRHEDRLFLVSRTSLTTNSAVKFQGMMITYVEKKEWLKVLYKINFKNIISLICFGPSSFETLEKQNI